MYVFGFIVTTTLAYLFFVVKNKVVVKDETVFKKHLQNVKNSIKNVSQNCPILLVRL